MLPQLAAGPSFGGIFAYLLAWSDYLVAVVFLRADSHFTLTIGLQTFFSSNETCGAT